MPITSVIGQTRPGWLEIIVGLSIFIAIGFGGGAALARIGLDPILKGLIFTALSGVAGLAGFVAAASLRRRSWSAFGVRRVTQKWLWIGFGAGLLAFVVKGVVLSALIKIIGSGENVQNIYAVGGSAGLWSAVLATVFLGVLTPLGEEFLFRGVVTNALLRYGAVVGVVGSTAIFAVTHGLNMVLPAAVVAGLATGELFRRSGSIWPCVILHAVFNLPTIPLMLLAGTAR